ncbi:MAG: glycosyltransferase family 2 protein [Pseudomonadales bacterium]|nr:glycosyltransferase family 2 protein [Pseudomonadales bacterium]
MSDLAVSIVIATYNSALHLPRVLKALNRQTMPRNEYEVILVDGYSSDETKAIGADFDCKIIDNPRIEPVYAKYLGLLNAKGKYIVYLDHDEVLQNSRSLENRVTIMKNDFRIRSVLTSGYRNPQGFPFINQYINEFGEPFSFFIYRLSKDCRFFINTMRCRYQVAFEDGKQVTFNLGGASNLPIIELCAAGSMIDREYLLEKHPEIRKRPDLVPHYFYLLFSELPYISIAKDDILDHFSAEFIGKYLKKIEWRIKNNTYFQEQMGSAGFYGRSQFQNRWGQVKKYLFLPYALIPVFSLIDALLLSYSRRHPGYLLHAPLCFWTGLTICYHMLRKISGHKPELRNYDDSKGVTGNSEVEN